MTWNYLNNCLTPSYAAPQRIQLWLSPGDGFKDLPLCPIWL
jgi:hypothetical protein